MPNVLKSVPAEAPELYRRALDHTLLVVRGIRPDQWHNATPDDGWDLRQLVNHITSENLWVAEIFSGRTMEDVGTSLDGDVLGEDPIEAYAQSVAKAKAVITPAALDDSYALSMGKISGRDYVTQMFMDQLVHAWDVMKGSRQAIAFDDDLLEAAIPVAEEMVALAGQGTVFGYRQEAQPGASRMAVLLAILGRREDWMPPAGAQSI